MQLYTKITIGLVLGAVVGLLANIAGITETAVWTSALLPLMDFAGNAFIRAIMMIVIPLVVASLTIGVASLGDTKALGRIGGKTIGYYLVTTSIAITIGLTLALLIRPGAWLSPEARDDLAGTFEEQAGGAVGIAEQAPTIWETLLGMIPNNPVASAAEGNLLPLIIFVVIFSAAISQILPSRRDAILNFFHAVNDASMVVIDWIMKTAPYAVFALIAAVISRFGLEVLQSLAIYTGVVAAGLILHAILTYGTFVSVLAKLNPIRFFKAIREAQLIAFSTSSSNATLPVTMEVSERNLGVSERTSSFVLPLGATLNMDGTALYQGVATVFIAQGLRLRAGARGAAHHRAHRHARLPRDGGGAERRHHHSGPGAELGRVGSPGRGRHRADPGRGSHSRHAPHLGEHYRRPLLRRLRGTVGGGDPQVEVGAAAGGAGHGTERGSGGAGRRAGGDGVARAVTPAS
jgi:Na+/H+-dicarboxylate symporter